MNYAVCEDDLIYAELIGNYLKELKESNISFYHEGKTFLDDIKSGKKFDFIILDISLPDILGTQIANMINKELDRPEIVFVSAYPQYVTDAFNLHASQFFIKPLNKKMFLNEISRLIRRRQQKSKPWCIQVKNGFYRIMPNEIVYVEAYHRKLMIQTKTHLITIPGKMEDAKEHLSLKEFSQCHQGYLINMRHIQSIHQDDIVFVTGHKAPISSRKRKNFLDEYASFVAL